ncbi:hypothetical protein [Bradyrhizobium guangdongense]
MKTFAQVAIAANLSPGRVSQLFGASKKEENINPTNLASIVRCFQDEDIPIEIDAFYSDYSAFTSSIRNTRPKPPGSGIDNSAANDPFNPPSDEWHPDQPQTYTELAIVQLHAPRPLNSRPDCYYVDVSLRFTTADYELDGHLVVVGLRQANLTLTSDSYAIAHMSLLGDAARPYKGITPSLRGIKILPHESDVMLSGNPLDEHYLAIIEPAPAATGRDEVNVVLDAPSRGFAFALKDSDTERVHPPPSSNKDAILNLIYGEMLERCRVSKSGRFLVARAVVRRRTSE